MNNNKEIAVQQFLDLLPDTLPNNSNADPNFIALPLFYAAPEQGTHSGEIQYHSEYSYGDKHYKVTFKTPVVLTRLDRTMLSLIEMFYAYQNPTFDTEDVFFSFADIRRLLGTSSNNIDRFKQSLQRLREVNVKILFQQKVGDDYKYLETDMNLIPFLQMSGYREKKIDGEVKPERADVVRVKLNEYHIANIRAGFVRYIPIDKIIQIKNETAGLIVYWIMAFGFIRAEDDSIKPKPNFKVKYDTLCLYLHLKVHTVLSKARYQMQPAFRALTDHGIVEKYDIWQDQEKTLWIAFKINPLSVWSSGKLFGPNAKKKLPNDIKNQLEYWGLSSSQINNVNMSGVSLAQIQYRINQMEWLLKNMPEQIRDQNTGRYLYKAIIEQWDNAHYKAYLEKEEQKEAERTAMRQQEMFQTQQKQIEEMMRKKQEERIAAGQLLYDSMAKEKQDETKQAFRDTLKPGARKMFKEESTAFMTALYSYVADMHLGVVEHPAFSSDDSSLPTSEQ